MSTDASHEPSFDRKGLIKLVGQATIAHASFKAGRVRLDRCLERKLAGRNTCVAVVGESGVGKTWLAKDLGRRHKALRNADGTINPLLYVKTPSAPTVKGLAQWILRSLGDPHYLRGTERELTGRIYTLFGETGALMLILDEFQQLYHNVPERVMYDTCDWLKNLVDDTEVTLVVTGLPDCMTVIRMNEQLIRRFEAPIELSRFEWDKVNGNAEFVSVLRALRTALVNAGLDLPDFASPEMAFRFYVASGGLMGYLTKLLIGALDLVYESGRPTMTFEMLHQAHKTEVLGDPNFGSTAQGLSPFTDGFQPLVSEALLTRVRLIGTATVEIPRKRNTRRPKKPQGICTATVENARA